MRRLDLKKVVLSLLVVATLLVGGGWISAHPDSLNHGLTKFIASVQNSLHTDKSVADYSSFPQTTKTENNEEVSTSTSIPQTTLDAVSIDKDTSIVSEDETMLALGKEDNQSVIVSENDREKRITTFDENGEELAKVYTKPAATYYYQLSTGAKYETLQAALTYAEQTGNNPETITVLSNVSETNGATVWANSKLINLNMNGKTITFTDSTQAIDVEGNLQIQGTGKFKFACIQGFYVWSTRKLNHYRSSRYNHHSNH